VQNSDLICFTRGCYNSGTATILRVTETLLSWRKSFSSEMKEVRLFACNSADLPKAAILQGDFHTTVIENVREN
jgi:hypothetical protein